MIVLWILLWILLGVVGLFLSYILLIIISSLFVDMKKEYPTDSKYYRWLLHGSTAVAMTLMWVHVHKSGFEKLPKDGRFVMVSNHRSKFDPIICWWIFAKYNLSFISKPENFKVPIYGRIIHRCCYMAIDRENPRNAMKTINRAVDLINRDVASIAVYPEGTRNYQPGLLPFHNAVFKIAQKANVPLVVITVRGADRVHKNYPFHRSDVYIDVLDVLEPETLKHLKTNEIGDIVRANMLEKLNEEA